MNRGSFAGHGQRHDPRNYTKKTDSTQKALTFAKIHRVSLFLLPLPELLRILCVKSVRYERHLTASYFSTMSFFWVTTKASNSSFSVLGTLYLSSASTRCFAAAFQSSSVIPSPVCVVFISRPM